MLSKFQFLESQKHPLTSFRHAFSWVARVLSITGYPVSYTSRRDFLGSDGAKVIPTESAALDFLTVDEDTGTVYGSYDNLVLKLDYKTKEVTNQNSLFRSRDWLSANQGPLPELTTTVLSSMEYLTLYYRFWLICVRILKRSFIPHHCLFWQ
eukprot:sb/3473428/